MSSRSTLSGYPKILNVWSIYIQYRNSQARKQGIFGISIWTYTIHSFKTTKWKYRTCFHFLLFLNTVCIKQLKFSKLFHHIWFFSMSRKHSWVHTIWHCNLTATWPTLCHCWGVSNPMLTTAYFHCLTWRSLEPCQTRLDPKARPNT